MQLIRTTSENSYFLKPKFTKTDRRNYALTRPLPEACLFVASLSNLRSVSQIHKSLHRHFSRFGKVLQIKVSVDKQNRPFAFVQFERVHDATKALKTVAMIDGRQIRIEFAKVEREIQVLVNDCPLVVAEPYFKFYGPCESITCMQHDHGLVVFVKYCHREDAVSALKQLPKKGWLTKW